MTGVSEPTRRPLVPAEELTEPACTAKLFMHGGSQAVRLPKAFRFVGKEVRIRREGDAVILEPAGPPPPKTPATPEEWAAFWAWMDEMEAANPWPDREQPPRQERDLDFDT